MKLSQWAKLKGISYLTAYRWFKAGKIPQAVQHHSGTIMILNEDVKLDRKDEIKNDLKRISDELNNVINEIKKINGKL